MKDLGTAPFNAALIGRMSEADFRLVCQAYKEYLTGDATASFCPARCGCDDTACQCLGALLTFTLVWPCVVCCIDCCSDLCCGAYARRAQRWHAVLAAVNARSLPNGVSVTPHGIPGLDYLQFDLNQAVRPRRRP